MLPKNQTLTLQERAEREREFMVLIEQGKTVSEMADTLKISTQAVRKFMKLRKWTVTPKP